MDSPPEFKVTFAYEKETKNTYRYTEQPEAGQPPRIGSLYIQKWALGAGQPPRQIVVTVACVT
jgi:hypothetical protein